QHVLEQVALVLEILVDEPVRDVGRLRDVGDRGARVALLGEYARCRREDRLVAVAHALRADRRHHKALRDITNSRAAMVGLSSLCGAEICSRCLLIAHIEYASLWPVNATARQQAAAPRKEV